MRGSHWEATMSAKVQLIRTLSNAERLYFSRSSIGNQRDSPIYSSRLDSIAPQAGWAILDQFKFKKLKIKTKTIINRRLMIRERVALKERVRKLSFKFKPLTIARSDFYLKQLWSDPIDQWQLPSSIIHFNEVEWMNRWRVREISKIQKLNLKNSELSGDRLEWQHNCEVPALQ